MSALLADQAWQVRAACRGPQSIVFFPPPHFERKDEISEYLDRMDKLFHRDGDPVSPSMPDLPPP